MQSGREAHGDTMKTADGGIVISAAIAAMFRGCRANNR